MINFIATFVQLEQPTAPTMTSLLGDLASVVTSVIVWLFPLRQLHTVHKHWALY